MEDNNCLYKNQARRICPLDFFDVYSARYIAGKWPFIVSGPKLTYIINQKFPGCKMAALEVNYNVGNKIEHIEFGV